MIRTKSVTVKVISGIYPGEPVRVQLTDYSGPGCIQREQSVTLSYEKFCQYEREACVRMKPGVSYRCHDYYWTAQ